MGAPKRIGYILGRRARGDLELDLDPKTQRLGEIIAPGARIASRPEQDILEESEDQNYVIGSRRYVDDRVFRYCYAKENLDYRTGVFMEKLLYWEGESEGAWDADVKTIAFDNTGVLAATPIPAHALKDGWIVTANQCQRIKDNTVEAGGVTSITLYRGLKVALTDTQTMYVYPNIYANIRNHGGVNAQAVLGTVVAVALFDVTAKRYFWGLTYGIFYGICGNMASDVALSEGKRVFGFDGFGEMIYRDVAHGGVWQDSWFQPGGYVMLDGNGATAGGDQLCMLQLAP